MKKIFYGIAAAFAVVAMASCGNSGKGNCGKDSCEGKCEDDCVKVYAGVLPAADAEGVRYDLKLEFDKDDNCLKGDYELRETYLEADSVGTKDGKSFRSEGDFTVTDKDGKKVYKLVQDMKDSEAGSAVGPMYFVVDNDSTITLVNENLERAVNPDMNYSLTLSK